MYVCVFICVTIIIKEKEVMNLEEVQATWKELEGVKYTLRFIARADIAKSYGRSTFSFL